MITFGSFSCPLLEGPEMVSEGFAASWVKWLILNAMLAVTYIVEIRNNLK